LSGRTITAHVCCTKSIKFGYRARVWLGDGDIFENMFISVTSFIEDVFGLWGVRSDGPEHMTLVAMGHAWCSEYNHAALVRFPAVVYLWGDGIGEWSRFRGLG
jgi:uncharacterized protein YegJ (DUF2314 family)